MAMKNLGPSAVTMAGLIVNIYGVRHGDKPEGTERVQRTGGMVVVNRGIAGLKPHFSIDFTRSGHRSVLALAYSTSRQQETLTVPLSFVIRSGAYDIQAPELRSVRSTVRQWVYIAQHSATFEQRLVRRALDDECERCAFRTHVRRHVIDRWRGCSLEHAVQFKYRDCEVVADYPLAVTGYTGGGAEA